MAIKVMVTQHGSKIVDDEAGKVYTPAQWQEKLASERSARGAATNEADEEVVEAKDTSGVQEDTDEE